MTTTISPSLEILVVSIREAYWSGQISIPSMVFALGGETKHVHLLSQIVKGETYEDIGGPRYLPDYAAIAPYVSSVRSEYVAGGGSIERIAERLQIAPLMVRRILSGEYFRYLPGPTDRKLREYPNPTSLKEKLAALARDCEEWDRRLYPQRYIDHQKPVWLT